MYAPSLYGLSKLDWQPRRFSTTISYARKISDVPRLVSRRPWAMVINQYSTHKFWERFSLSTVLAEHIIHHHRKVDFTTLPPTDPFSVLSLDSFHFQPEQQAPSDIRLYHNLSADVDYYTTEGLYEELDEEEEEEEEEEETLATYDEATMGSPVTAGLVDCRVTCAWHFECTLPVLDGSECCVLHHRADTYY